MDNCCWSQAAMDGVWIRNLSRYADARGSLCELWRSDEAEVVPGIVPAMAYVSWTEPGQIRGPHEHSEQTDMFAFVGPGDFILYLWDNRPGVNTKGRHFRMFVGASRPLAVVIPPGVVHAYQNVSTIRGVVYNLPNKLYKGAGKAEDVDEIRHENAPDSLFKVPTAPTR